jgi:micrococcal nuclease
VIAIAVIVLIVAARVAFDFYVRDDTARIDEPLPEQWYDVDRVVDGDTIIVLYSRPDQDVAGGGAPERIRVRLIGIDAPELERSDHPGEPYGPEAAEFARDFLAGKKALLRFDRRKLDQYERVLAYVFVDDVMLNEEIVREGLAYARHYSGDDASMARRIRKAAQEAERAGRCLWSGKSGLENSLLEK